MRASLAAICLALLSAAAWSAPALQQLGATTGTEIALSSANPKAQVRQQITAPLRAGSNRLTFTWADEKIDLTSVRLHAGPELIVGETTRPAGSTTALAWDVTAPAGGEYPLTVSYLLSDLKWSASYRLSYQPGDGKATLEGYLTVSNESGLGLEGAKLSLALGRATGEGTGEQMVLSVPDITDLRVGAKARASFLPAMELPARLVYRVDGERAAEQVRRLLIVQPPVEGALAREPLPAGPASIVLLTEEGPAARWLAGEIKYALGEELELDLGVEPDIIVERTMTEQTKQNLDFDRLGRVAGFDILERYELVIRNRRSVDTQLEVIETVLETWDFSSRELHALDREEGVAVMHLTIAAGGAHCLQWALVKHSGTRIPKKD